MGRLPSNNRAYQIQDLQYRHREILRLASLGLSRQQIADQLGVTTAVVSYTTNSLIGRAHLSSIQNDRDSSFTAVSQRIKALAPVALKVLSKTLQTSLSKDGDITATEANIAKDILDRAGHGSVKKIQKDVNHRLTTEQSINAIKERAKSLYDNVISSSQDAQTDADIDSGESPTEQIGVAHQNRASIGRDIQDKDMVSLPIPNDSQYAY